MFGSLLAIQFWQFISGSSILAIHFWQYYFSIPPLAW
jgi:hypothetical protein